VVICLELGADLHMAQLMPLPLTVSYFSNIQIGLPFWYRLTRVVLDKGLLNVCVCAHVLSADRLSAALSIVCQRALCRLCMERGGADAMRGLVDCHSCTQARELYATAPRRRVGWTRLLFAR